MDVTDDNRNLSPTAPQKQIFVPAPHKVKVQRPYAKESISQTQSLEVERRNARREILNEFDKSISDPLQTILSMAELENRDDYRRQVERILNFIHDLHGNIDY